MPHEAFLLGSNGAEVVSRTHRQSSKLTKSIFCYPRWLRENRLRNVCRQGSAKRKWLHNYVTSTNVIGYM